MLKIKWTLDSSLMTPNKCINEARSEHLHLLVNGNSQGLKIINERIALYKNTANQHFKKIYQVNIIKLNLAQNKK